MPTPPESRAAVLPAVNILMSSSVSELSIDQSMPAQEHSSTLPKSDQQYNVKMVVGSLKSVEFET